MSFYSELVEKLVRPVKHLSRFLGGEEPGDDEISTSCEPCQWGREGGPTLHLAISAVARG